MAFAVVATANHYVIDVVAGLVVLLVSVLMARLWTRRLAQRGDPTMHHA